MVTNFPKLISEKTSRRFVLQLQSYFERQEMPLYQFLDLIDVSGYTWHTWTTGKTKKIRSTHIKRICDKLNLNMSFILGLMPDRGNDRFTKFVEFSEIYEGLRIKGDIRAMSQMVRRTALACYDHMLDEKLPVTLSMTNTVDDSVIIDDLVCLDCAGPDYTYRLQLIPGIQLSYCFGHFSSVTKQKILHEGVISMSIIIVIAEYLHRKLKETNVSTPDDGAFFIDQSRNFSKNLSKAYE